MPITVLDAGSVERLITAMKVMDGATLRTIRRVKVLDTDGTTLRTVAEFAPALSLDISPTGLFGLANSSGAVTVTTSGSATATPTGGTGPYTYAWTNISDTHASGTVSATASTSATSSFRMTNVGAFETYDAVVRCTVTDAIGQTAYDDLNITFINDGPFGL